jgi:hypothetical protein
MLDECIVHTQPYPDHEDDTSSVVCNKVGIPCNEYILDAEFDVLHHNAYRAPLSSMCEEDEEAVLLDESRVLKEVICEGIVIFF